MTRDSAKGLANMTTTVHRMVEAFKYSFALRSELGDPDFVNITEVGSCLLTKNFYINNN